MVAERYPPHIGGAPFCVHQLSSALVERGHRVHVVTGREPSTSSEEMLDGVKVFRVRRSTIPRLRGLSFLYSASRRLSALSGIYDYDLLHCHNGICGLLGPWWRGSFGKPYVFTLHGSIASSMETNPLVRYLARLIEESSVDRADAATFDGESIFEGFVGSTGLSRERAYYIPNAVDTDIFSSLRRTDLWRGMDPSRVNIVYVGRLVHGKGLMTLAEAFSQASEEMGTLSLILVGGGPYLERIRAYLSNRVLEDRVCFLGSVCHNYLPEVYARSSMVVLPSLSEGLSRVLLEAMACEKPVIVTDIPANLSLVQDEINGLVVGVGDVAGLSRAILRLAADKGLQRRLGREARETVLQRYRVERRVEDMLEVYFAVLKSSREE